MAPWQFGPLNFTVAGGGPRIVELKVPPRGRIRSIRMYQTGGDATTAEIRIVQSRAAARAMLDPGDPDFLAFDGTNPHVQSVFGVKIVPEEGLEETDKAYDYQNRDSGITTAARRLWLVIAPEGVGDKDYTLALLIADVLRD